DRQDARVDDGLAAGETERVRLAAPNQCDAPDEVGLVLGRHGLDPLRDGWTSAYFGPDDTMRALFWRSVLVYSSLPSWTCCWSVSLTCSVRFVTGACCVRVPISRTPTTTAASTSA